MDASTRLEKILRGELAAVESYQRALLDLEHADGADGRTRSKLEELLEDHRRAVSTLQRHLEADEDAEPDDDPGAWGAFAKAVQKAGAALGDNALLEAMKQGEVHGASEYRTALDQEGVPQPLRAEIRDRLLPETERHVATLDELMGR